MRATEQEPALAYRKRFVEGGNEAAKLHVFGVLDDLKYADGFRAVGVAKQGHKQRAVDVALLCAGAAQVDVLAVLLHVAACLGLGRMLCHTIVQVDQLGTSLLRKTRPGAPSLLGERTSVANE